MGERETFEMRIGKSSLIFFRVIGKALLASLLFFSLAWGAEEKGAEEAVKRMNSALMESMKRGEDIGFQGRYRILFPVIRDVFDIPFMGEVSLGSHWKTLTKEQRELFLGTYTDWTVSSYAGNFDSYSGEKFEVKNCQEGRGNRMIVVSDLVRPREDPVSFYYTLRRFQGKWRIVDIKIEGVSQLALTRGQFVSVMKKNGIDGLMLSLKEKIALLRERENEED
jgi:phospholipid transport system substrate-binding protein